MKKLANLYSEIIDTKNLFLAWHVFRKNKKKKKDVLAFEWALETNIFTLNRELAVQTYRHGPYTGFYITDPKRRHIHKAIVRDRVLHHAIYSRLYMLYDPTFIDNSFSCRNGRIREDLAYLHTNRLSLLKSGAYTPDGIVAEEERLQSELVELQEQENTSDVAMAELMKEVVILSELIRNVVPVYDFAKPHEKERISRVIFSELFVAHDTLQYKLKKGFEPFSDHLSAICDPTGNRTPIYAVKGRCPSR